jgi:membrane protein DedA with SNARE-associated domain
VPDLSALWPYFVTFSLLVAAGFGFPIPEELPVVFAGAATGHADVPEVPPRAWETAVSVLAASPGAPFPAAVPWGGVHESGQIRVSVQRNTLRWWIMLPVCILGVVISDSLLYGMGRFWGPRLLDKRGMKRVLPPPKRQRIERNFQKYGVWVLLFARFLPAIRSPIFIMAGIMRVSFGRFLLADGLYAIPGVSLLFFLSFQFGDKFRNLVEEAEGRVQRIKPLLILLAITAFASYLVYHFLRHPISTGDPEELPLIGEQVAAKIEHPGKPTQPAPTNNSAPHADGADTPQAKANRRGERGASAP